MKSLSFNLLYDFVSQGKAESTTSLQLRLEIQVGNESRSAEGMTRPGRCAFMGKTPIVPFLFVVYVCCEESKMSLFFLPGVTGSV